MHGPGTRRAARERPAIRVREQLDSGIGEHGHQSGGEQGDGDVGEADGAARDADGQGEDDGLQSVRRDTDGAAGDAVGTGGVQGGGSLPDDAAPRSWSIAAVARTSGSLFGCRMADVPGARAASSIAVVVAPELGPHFCVSTSAVNGVGPEPGRRAPMRVPVTSSVAPAASMTTRCR